MEEKAIVDSTENPEQETEELIKKVIEEQQKQKKKQKKNPIFKRSYGNVTGIILKIIMVIYIFCPLILQVLMRGVVIFLYVLAQKHANFFHWAFFFIFCFIIVMAVVFSVVCVLIEEARKVFVTLSTIFSILFAIFAFLEIFVVLSLQLPRNDSIYVVLIAIVSIISLSGFIVPTCYCIFVWMKSFNQKKHKKKRNGFF